MTDAQQIFAVFYAIFFGLMLQTIGARRSLTKNSEDSKRFEDSNPHSDKTRVKNASLNLFDTPNAWAIGSFYFDNKPFWRTVLSIAFLNLLPGAIFAVVFIGLGQLDKALGLLQIIAIVWVSLAPQQIYRFFYSLLTIRDGEWIYLTGDKYKKYADYDIAALAMLREDRGQFQAHKQPLNHLAFPLFVYLPSGILSLLYLLWEKLTACLYCVGVAVAVTLLCVGIILFLLQPKEK